MPTDPDVPKRLASRLRASYARVYSARDDIAYKEAKSRDNRLELDEYDTDPSQYAALRYPRDADPGAYPTFTRTSRLQDSLDRRESQMSQYHEALLIAEADMARTEAEALAELQRMRSVTPGREPWPARPAALSDLRKRWEREFSSNRKKYAKALRDGKTKRERDAARREEEHRKFLAEMAETIRTDASMMSPGKAAAYLSMMEVLQEKMSSGDFGASDIYEIAAGDSPKMKAMIAEAEARAIARVADLDKAD